MSVHCPLMVMFLLHYHQCFCLSGPFVYVKLIICIKTLKHNSNNLNRTDISHVTSLRPRRERFTIVNVKYEYDKSSPLTFYIFVKFMEDVCQFGGPLPWESVEFLHNLKFPAKSWQNPASIEGKARAK